MNGATSYRIVDLKLHLKGRAPSGPQLLAKFLENIVSRDRIWTYYKVEAHKKQTG